MLNRKPIFIHGFSRGGSNILLNILYSHPDLCSPGGENQEVFNGKTINESFSVKMKKRLKYFPILLAQQENIFSYNLKGKPRKKVSLATMERIDKILFDAKLEAREPGMNLYKTEKEKYTDSEIANARLFVKNLNGMIFLHEMFTEMYPDATFISLVRDGLAVCEGHIRRGVKLETIANHYNKICNEMRNIKNDNHFIVRFEDILSNPIEMLNQIYKKCDLEVNDVEKIRLESKAMINKDGKHEFKHGKTQKEVIWYSLEDFHKHFDKDINQNQINRLTEAQRSKLLEILKDNLEFFKYI